MEGRAQRSQVLLRAPGWSHHRCLRFRNQARPLRLRAWEGAGGLGGAAESGWHSF